MKSAVICISGGIASGKTTLASALADETKLPHASFGRFIRSAAGQRNLTEDRGQLQQIGEHFIEELGWDLFCSRVLSAGGWSVGGGAIVEGIRHVAAFDTITRLVSPVRSLLVFILATTELREDRIRANRPKDLVNLAEAEIHSTERDVHELLIDRADLVLDGRRDQRYLVQQVLNTIRLE